MANTQLRWVHTVSVVTPGSGLPGATGMVYGEIAVVEGYYSQGDGVSGEFFFDLATHPEQISAATNASPIVITTAAAHGLITGQRVTIRGVQGNSAANGAWTITVTGTSTFALNGSTGNGAYTSGGAVGDGGLSIPSDSTVRPGIWRRLWDRGTPITVRDFGAWGNGAADDTGAFQSTFCALAAAGGTIVVPPGTYRVGNIAISKPVEIRLGAGARIVGIASPILTVMGVNITIRGADRASSTITSASDGEIFRLQGTFAGNNTGKPHILFDSVGLIGGGGDSCVFDGGAFATARFQ